MDDDFHLGQTDSDLVSKSYDLFYCDIDTE